MPRDTVQTLGITMNAMNKEIAEVKDDIKTITNKIDANNKEITDKLDRNFSSFLKEMKEMRTEMDLKYASKRTEHNVDRLAWLVVTAIVGSVLGLIVL